MTKEDYENKLDLYKTFSKEAGRLRWDIFKYKFTHFIKFEKMKAVKLFCILVTIGFILQVFILNQIESQVIKLPGITKIVYVSDSAKSFTAFLTDIAKLESGDRYDIESKLGYLGRYQIGRLALNDIGMGGITSEDFKTTPEVQELAMRMLLRKNKKYLQAYIGKYSSKKVCGIRIDESALLAAAHLTGVGSVMQFLDSNGDVDPVDGNGIKTSSRLKKFEGYKLDL
jgi:hypothetical protein